MVRNVIERNIESIKHWSLYLTAFLKELCIRKAVMYTTNVPTLNGKIILFQ